ncbi:type II toxin-antitoxin system RelE/ParE family toxin [Providencia rettgeri]
MNYLEFIETMSFSKIRRELFTDDEFQEFQTYLLNHYEDGDVISHSGGCRKIRWSRKGMGKRGGVRVIYYARTISGRIYLLLVYPKNSQSDLTHDQKSQLRMVIDKMK